MQGVQRIVLTASRSEPVGKTDEVFLVDGFQNCRNRLLDDLVLHTQDAPRIMHLMEFAFGMTGEDGRSLQPIFAGADPHCH
jgi:hypothetical protein